jgi:flagellar FliJ protein
MKRFRFRLEGVLRVRRIQQDQARAALLAANVAVATAAQRVAERRDYYVTRARPTGVQTYAAMERTMFTLDSAAGAIAWAENERAIAAAEAVQRRAAWAEAEQRVRALERLRIQALDQHALAERREETRAADEIATAGYRKRTVSA